VALLLCFMDEESAFWTLCSICEVLFPEYYNNGFLGLIIDQRGTTYLVLLFPESHLCDSRSLLGIGATMLP